MFSLVDEVEIAETVFENIMLVLNSRVDACNLVKASVGRTRVRLIRLVQVQSMHYLPDRLNLWATLLRKQDLGRSVSAERAFVYKSFPVRRQNYSIGSHVQLDILHFDKCVHAIR